MMRDLEEEIRRRRVSKYMRSAKESELLEDELGDEDSYCTPLEPFGGTIGVELSYGRLLERLEVHYGCYE